MKSNRDMAVLLIRVGLGLVFLSHGLAKFVAMDETVAVFNQVGLNDFWAYLISASEILGALSMFIGIGVEWAGVLLALEMLGSAILVKLSSGFLTGYQFDIMLFLAALSMSFSGPGYYVLEGILPKKKKK